MCVYIYMRCRFGLGIFVLAIGACVTKFVYVKVIVCIHICLRVRRGCEGGLVFVCAGARRLCMCMFLCVFVCVRRCCLCVCLVCGLSVCGRVLRVCAVCVCFV